MTRLLAAITLLAASACQQWLAPIFPGTPTCQTVTDCQDGWICHPVEGEAERVCVQSTGPRCGDGEIRNDIAEGVAGYEACDDGNILNRDGCTNECKPARCGDGYQRLDRSVDEEGGEDCDDGNNDDRDGCTNACQRARCGDGLLRQDLSEGEPGFEACDDGNRNAQDACTNDCHAARCGDGIQRSDVFAGNPAYEACDDGNQDDLDRCDVNCQPTRCGDGIIQELANEACEDENDVNEDACTNDCQFARCGDGIHRRDLSVGQEGFENCDDGNTDNGDLCPSNCQGGVVALVGCRSKNTMVQMATASIYYFGQASDGEVRVISTPNSQRPRQISCGTVPCILTEEGAVQCLVSLADPEVWEPRHPGPYTAISSGVFHQCALDEIGQVWCWGHNIGGAVGIEVGDDPIEVITEPTRVEGLTGVQQIAANEMTTCALDDQGVIACWGSNMEGQTGAHIDISSHSSPTVVEGVPPARQVILTGTSSCALVTEEDEDAVYCWGGDRQGLISLLLPPVGLLRIQGDARVETGIIAQDYTGQFWRLTWVGDAQTGAGGYEELMIPDDTLSLSTVWGPAACFLSPVEGIRCWGNNSHGQLGQGTRRITRRATRALGISGAVELALGRDHSCARLEDGTVRCWGSDELNQLGSAETSPPGSLPVTVHEISNAEQVVAGQEHTCARLADGSVRCWGARGNAQRSRLGDGGVSDGAIPIQVDYPNPVEHLAAGGEFTLMLGHRENGNSFVNGFGENSGRVLSDMQANYSRPGYVASLPPSRSLVAGEQHACVHLQNHEIRCWGENNQLQLGLENNLGGSQRPPGEGEQWVEELAIDGLGPVAQVAAGSVSTCIRREDGSVLCWGHPYYSFPETPILPSGSIPDLAAQSIAMGHQHTCALVAGGEVRCWGWNDHGQRGDGLTSNDLEERHEPRPVVGLPRAHHLVAGHRHTCAITGDQGEVWCWGRNSRNQVGNGYIESSETPLPIQGRLGAAEAP